MIFTPEQLEALEKMLRNRYEKPGVGTGYAPLPQQETRTIEERLQDIESRLASIERDLLPHRRFGGVK